MTNGTREYITTNNTKAINAPINFNVTKAIVNDFKEKVVNDTKEEAVIRTIDNVPKVNSSVSDTESVPFHKHSTAKPTEESNVLKIAKELKLLERLTAILPGVLDEKINSNKNNDNETAKKDLEVFEQYSLSHYLDPEAEVVVFRKNERSPRQISDFPPQKHSLSASNGTETRIFNLVPDNNADRADPTIYAAVDGTKKLNSNAPPQTLDKDNGSQKLISDMPKSDFNPILHLSQCNSCITSLNKINWNMPEPIKTVNNQQFDIIQYPLQIPNTDMFKSQNSFESDRGNYVYLSPALHNPHLLQGYRRINHMNNHFNRVHHKFVKPQMLRASDDPSDHYGVDKFFKSNNKNKMEHKLGKDNSIFLEVQNNPYGELELVHSTSNKMFTNVPDLNNMYPWLLGNPSLHSALSNQPLPPMHSLLMVNEPESKVELTSVTPADIKKFSRLTINKDKFDYYDTLVNLISNKNTHSNNNKHSAIDPVDIFSDTSVKEAANEKLVLKMNELKQNLIDLIPQERRGFQEQPMSDKKYRSEPIIQYLKVGDTSAKSDKLSQAAEMRSANKIKQVAREGNNSENANQLSKTAAVVSKKPESNINEATSDQIQFQFEIPPIEMNIAKRRAIDSNIEGNLQREMAEPFDTLIKQLLQANGFDRDKIEKFWPQFVALLGNHIAYLPKYIPYYYLPNQVPNNNMEVQNNNVPDLPITDSIRNVDIKDFSTLNVISNNTEHIAQSNASTRNNETIVTVNYNITDSIQNTLQSLLASHNITNNSDTISVSTTILLDVTDNDTSLDPKDIRRHLEIIKIENNANNASVLLLNKKNYDEILKSLDSFTLERKKAYVTVVPTVKAIESSDIGRSNDNRTADPTFLDKIFGNEYIPEKEVTIGPAKEESIDTKDFLDNPQVFSALKKQTELMGKLLLKLRGENARKNAGKDFQDLIKQVEAKKHGTYTTEMIADLNKRIGDETKTPPTTVMTMIDETEVRKALRNSPYVKRILKLSKQKRDRYYQGKKTSDRKKH